jgi:hypothetical protein
VILGIKEGAGSASSAATTGRISAVLAQKVSGKLVSDYTFPDPLYP